MLHQKLIFKTLLILSGITLSALVIYLILPAEWQPLFLKVAAVALIPICYIVIIIDFVFLIPTIHGAIYLPSSDSHISTILKLAKPKKGETAVDIGSGDGRLVVALAQAGTTAHGYEINPILVIWSKIKWANTAVSKQIHFHWANMWTVKYSQYQIVTVFGMSYIMKDLERKLLAELKPGARVICNSFPFPNWKARKKSNSVYLYVR